MIQTAIVIIVFGAVCGLLGYLFAWDKAWKQGHKHGKREVYKEQWEAAGKAMDDILCEHPQEDKPLTIESLQEAMEAFKKVSPDPYRRLLDDICRLPEKPMVIDDPPQKIPPEWE